MTMTIWIGACLASILAGASLLLRLPEERELARVFGFLIGFWILVVAALT